MNGDRRLFFLPYQRRWICDTSRVKILEKSRQIGMSWATAYRLVRNHSGRQYRVDSWISSRDETQAKLFVADCYAFTSLFDCVAKKFHHRVISEEDRPSALSITFANGTAIHSLSSNPDAQAGKRGNRILDEFALHSDPRSLYVVTAPGITWGGQLEILSTHRGSLNFFNQLIQEARFGGNPKKFSLHRVTLHDALDQGFLAKLKTKLPDDDPRQEMDEAQYFDFIRASCPDEVSFQQEFMCRPMDDREAFLPTAMIDGCTYDRGEEWSIPLPYFSGCANPLEGTCYLGVDLGRTQDLTVFWLLERVGDVMRTRLVKCLQGQTFAAQEHTLHEILAIPHLRRVCIDQTGMGRQFTERAISVFGSGRVEGVTFTAEVKETLAYLVRMFFDKKEIRIPDSDAIRADLHSIRREMTTAGNVRFSADRHRNGHADRFWALALALHAYRGKAVAMTPAVLQIIHRPPRQHFLF